MKLGKTVRSEFRDVSYPAGTEVTLLEPLDGARRVWLVEVRVADASLVGGAAYDTVEVSLADVDVGVTASSLEAEAASAELRPEERAVAARSRTKDVRLPDEAKALPRAPVDAHPQA